jgi:hypothetical protein
MIVDITSTQTFPGVAKPLFKLTPAPTFSDVTRDGQRFLMALPFEEDAQTPFTAVLNWKATRM